MSWKDAANLSDGGNIDNSQNADSASGSQVYAAIPNAAFAETAEQNGSDLRGTSMLEGWKTSIGMFVLGLVCSMAFGYAISFASAYFGAVSAIVWVVLAICLVCVAFIFVYALAIYPSLFGERPKLKSIGAISFLNAFAGSLVFGSLWCCCLRRKRKGVSQYVLTVLLAVGLVGGFVSGFMDSGIFSSSASLNTPPQAVSSSSASASASSSQQAITKKLGDSPLFRNYNVVAAGWKDSSGEINFYNPPLHCVGLIRLRYSSDLACTL